MGKNKNVVKNLFVNNEAMRKTAFYGASVLVPFGLVYVLCGDVPLVRQNEKRYPYNITTVDSDGFVTVSGSLENSSNSKEEKTIITVVDEWDEKKGPDDRSLYYRSTSQYELNYAYTDLFNYSKDDISLLEEELGDAEIFTTTEVRDNLSDSELNEGKKMSYVIYDQSDDYILVPQSKEDNTIGSIFYLLLASNFLGSTYLALEDKQKKLIK